MSGGALHPFLNSFDSINFNYVDKLFDKAESLIDTATKDIEKIANMVLKPLDFSGITPDFVDPSYLNLMGLPVAPIQPLLNEVNVEQFPDSPFLTTAQIATDALLTQLIAQEVTEIMWRLNNSTGLTPAVEAAIWQRSVDRESSLASKAYQVYLDNNSALGWSSPAGQDQAAFMAFQQDKTAKLSDLSRDIMVKQADLEQNNLQKTLDYLQTLQAQLFEQKQSDEGNKIKLFDSLSENADRKTRLYIDINKAKIEVFAEQVQAYVAAVGASESQAEFYLKKIDAINQVQENFSTIALEKLKIMQSYEASQYQAAVEAEKAIAGVAGNLAATLFNAVNLGWSNSEGKSWSYSESLSA